MSSKEKIKIEKQIEKHQKKIQEIKEKSEKLNQQFNNINKFEKNVQPLYNMPNTHNTRKKQSKSVTKSVSKSTEEQRKKWREAKARAKKISNEKKQKKTQSLPQEDLDDFEFNPIMEEEGPIMDIQESQPRYRTPPEIIEKNPFQNEIMRFDHDAEKNMFAKIGDVPLSVENTPTKSKKGGKKTRKNKKR